MTGTKEDAEQAFAKGAHNARNGAPVEPVEPVAPVSLGGMDGTGAALLDKVRAWLARFICTVDDGDLDVLTVWAAHTHLLDSLYTTPRLFIDSPVPGSGKTTVLEHLDRLCHHPVLMASVTSPALLTRLLDAERRTLLIDEADRTLRPDREGVQDLLAVINSGYKRGGTRPVLVPVKGGSWAAKEMKTFAAIAFAGNSPVLPDDTRSRTIRVLLMPGDGTTEESDWEAIDQTARDLGEELAEWAKRVTESVKVDRPSLPDGVKGRARERWTPLVRLAHAAGGRWPGAVERLALADLERMAMEQEDGIMTERPAVVLLRHMTQVWDPSRSFISTVELLARLIGEYPAQWGAESSYGKALTVQRLGRMLASGYNVHSRRADRTGPRGYRWSDFDRALNRLGIPLKETGATGATGETGAGSHVCFVSGCAEAAVNYRPDLPPTTALCAHHRAERMGGR